MYEQKLSMSPHRENKFVPNLLLVYCGFYHLFQCTIFWSFSFILAVFTHPLVHSDLYHLFTFCLFLF